MTDDPTTYRLEPSDKRAEKAGARMDRIEAGINGITLILVKPPTKGDLLTYSSASLAIGLTFPGLVVGGIVGGPGWIKIH